MTGLLLARHAGVSPVTLFLRARQGVGILAAASVVLLCIGALVLAAPEGRHPDRTRGRRRVLWVLAPLAVVLVNLDLLPPEVRGELIPLLRVSAWVSPAASIAVTSMGWWVLHDSVRRIPARRCAKLTTLLAAAVAIGGPALLISMRPRIFFVLLVAPWNPQFAPLTIAPAGCGGRAHLLLGAIPFGRPGSR